jgi:class 3 adenylate cyclase
MGVLGVHAIVYATVCLLLVLLWLMLGGDPSALARPLTGAREQGLWPFWVAATWGTLLGMHAALTLLGRRRRRRRRARRRGQDGGSRWITAMFTDICGSTRLVNEVGDEAYSDLIAAHRRTVRGLVRDHRGSEIGTQGDGFLLRFPSPREALACAAQLQRRLEIERAGDPRVPRVRIGVHAGEVITRDGDVLGRMVNIAARVADSAGPDEIVVTEPVADHADPGLRFEDRGLHELRGVEGPRHLLAVRWATDDEAVDGGAAD